jgi:hypothetical protein
LRLVVSRVPTTEVRALPLDGRCPLEYKIEMQTVVETPSYLKAAEALFTKANAKRL